MRAVCWMPSWILLAGLFVSPTVAAETTEIKIGERTFTVPDGFTIELVAGPPLVDRPISASFDERGRLFVTESSGTNDNVQKQLAERPHRVLCLEDRDGDGTFEHRTVFADQMMFPEGAMWFDGSLYVAAPPSIWKLTDTDGDGQADAREEWFEGKTLTGCANDLHGPYLGPDGWIYWCKGAFAKQTYPTQDGGVFETRASHIFRRRPDSGLVEPVMTGGMDNPVELVFTPGGERIFNTTFLQHPGMGKRDGIIHAIYGGVYGKKHGVIEEHPRTGDVLPPLVHLGAAAPSGLERARSSAFGPSYLDAIYCTCFNMHKVTRHQLTPSGGTFAATNEDFVVCDDLDFHPTDVLEDADGSLLIVDTGGWYKLCCPTSQLWKPDIKGAIYRVRRIDGADADEITTADARGLQLDWDNAASDEVARRLADPRFAVRDRAKMTLARKAERDIESVLAALQSVITGSDDPAQRREAVWTTCWIADARARQLARRALEDDDALVRQVAVHAASLHRDELAVSQLVRLLTEDKSAHVQRVSAEALGRIGEADSVGALLSAIATAPDRESRHALTFALIELNAADATRAGLAHPSATVQAHAMVALDQMEEPALRPSELSERLESDQAEIRESAWWIVSRRPELSPLVADALDNLLTEAAQPNSPYLATLYDRLQPFFGDEDVQWVVAKHLSESSAPVQRMLLASIKRRKLMTLPTAWHIPLLNLLQEDQPDLVARAVDAISSIQEPIGDRRLVAMIVRIGQDADTDDFTRLSALRVGVKAGQPLDDPSFRFVVEQLPSESPSAHRVIAAEVCLKSATDPARHEQLVSIIPQVGPLELATLVEILAARSDHDPAFGIRLVDALAACPSVTSLGIEQMEGLLKPYGDEATDRANALIEKVIASNDDRLNKLQRILPLVETADIRRGQRVFHGEKASCAACHAVGYLGGRIGPDLTRIGRIRTEKDLLESILFPSATFVRSYEPVTITTLDGLVYNGIIQDETSQYLDLAINQEKSVRVRHEDIEERRASEDSIMPAGLDQQLTEQDLADLVKFLMSVE